MTLVAAYSTAGIPVMVGDFMLSTASGPVGESKKVFRGRPNLAIGWTGRHLHAQRVLIPLLTGLSDRPTRTELAAALASLVSSSPSDGPLKLIGWIEENRRLAAFHWDAAAPDLQWDEAWFVGTGGPAFEIYAKRYEHLNDDVDGQGERGALARLLAILAQLNASDVFVPAPSHSIGVGAGYEALYWSPSANAFEYVDDVIYFAVKAYLDSAGRVRAINPLPLLAYRTKREISFWTVVDRDDTRRAHLWASTPPATLERPASVEAEREAVAKVAMSAPPRFYAGVAAFAHPTEVAPAIPIVTCPWDEQPMVRGSLDAFAVQTGPRELEHHFRRRAAEQRDRPLPYESVRSPLRSDAWVRPAADLASDERSA